MARTFRTTTQAHLRAAVAGAAGAVVASPAFAATNFSLQTALAEFSTREWILGASGLLLVIALIARLSRGRTTASPVGTASRVDDVPDLRWWRNPELA